MQASNARTPIDSHSATIHVAIELSMKSWIIVIHSPDQDRLSRHRLEPGDSEGLLALIAKVRARAARVLGRAPAVVSCYEAGYDGFWLHRRLVAAGIENVVIDPASLTVDRRARRAKTDRIDGEKMIRSLMAYRRDEPRVMSVVRVPSPEQEDARRRSRERARLIQEQTGHLNRIKALLRTLGLAAGEPGRRNWAAWLAHQRDWQGQSVPPQLRAEIVREHARLMLVRDQIKALAAAPAPVATAAASAHLARLKSLGPAFSDTLASELLWKDFRNRRQVGAYCGLAPSPWQSGGVEHDQGIDKAGNRRARHAAIELAWLWLQHQPQSALSRWFHDRVGEQRGRVRRIAIVALARKLVIALWRFLTTGLVPTGAVLKA
ncbi:MAG: IS110 family transposase [Actinobacteria bacterium]|nr:IS110 family transposase [Actinomycetota bacterium]